MGNRLIGSVLIFLMIFELPVFAASALDREKPLARKLISVGFEGDPRRGGSPSQEHVDQKNLIETISQLPAEAINNLFGALAGSPAPENGTPSPATISETESTDVRRVADRKTIILVDENGVMYERDEFDIPSGDANAGLPEPPPALPASTNPIPVGGTPFSALVVNGKMYVVNNASSVSVVDMVTHEVVGTIPVSFGAFYSTAVGTKLYLFNYSNNNVTVIDTLTQTVSKVINVGNKPFRSTVAGGKIYIPHAENNSVAVIDTLNDDSVSFIPVGISPQYAVAIGTKLYVFNKGLGVSSGDFSIIDTQTNTVVAKLGGNWISSFFFSGSFAGAAGKYLYLPQYPTGKVWIMDTEKIDQLIASNPMANLFINTDQFAPGDPNNPMVGHIAVPGVTHVTVFGSEVWATDYYTDTTVVLDTVKIEQLLSQNSTDLTSAEVGRLAASTDISYAGKYRAVGDKIYVIKGNGIQVIDAIGHKVLSTIDLGTAPQALSVAGDKVYALNSLTGTIAVIDTATDTLFDAMKPALLSFSSPNEDRNYQAGESITISANLNKPLPAGSMLTVTLNTGSIIMLNMISGNTYTGSYMIGDQHTTPDLAITSACVSGAGGGACEPLSLASSPGNFAAENSTIKRDLGDVKNISIGSFMEIGVGKNPYGISSPVTVNGRTYIYVANQGAGTVSVIDTETRAVTATITVGSEPYGLSTVQAGGMTYIAVANTGSNTVSLINAADNSVRTIEVGNKPYYVATIGMNIYVTNSMSNSVSVINVDTMEKTTIPVGAYPRGIKVFNGRYLYVANYGDVDYGGGNSVTVIDSFTNKVIKTILLPPGSAGPRGVAISGNNVYVTNYQTNNVTVIDALTNTVTGSIKVGKGPRGILTVGSKLYVENFDEGSITVIDGLSKNILKKVMVGHSPAGMGLNGTDLYISNFQDGRVLILDTNTDTLLPIPVADPDPDPDPIDVPVPTAEPEPIIEPSEPEPTIDPLEVWLWARSYNVLGALTATGLTHSKPTTGSGVMTLIYSEMGGSNSTTVFTLDLSGDGGGAPGSIQILTYQGMGNNPQYTTLSAADGQAYNEALQTMLGIAEQSKIWSTNSWEIEKIDMWKADLNKFKNEHWINLEASVGSTSLVIGVNSNAKVSFGDGRVLEGVYDAATKTATFKVRIDDFKRYEYTVTLDETNRIVAVGSQYEDDKSPTTLKEISVSDYDADGMLTKNTHTTYHPAGFADDSQVSEIFYAMVDGRHLPTAYIVTTYGNMAVNGAVQFTTTKIGKNYYGYDPDGNLSITVGITEDYDVNRLFLLHEDRQNGFVNMFDDIYFMDDPGGGRLIHRILGIENADLIDAEISRRKGITP